MTKSKPLISVIILNYNAGELVSDCVESVLKSNYENLEVILVDNASKDFSHKNCKEKFPQIILVENKQNLGYCGGNNEGIKIAQGEFVVILNPDTLVDSEWLNELVSAHSKNGDGLYQPKFLTTNNHDILMSTGNMIQLFGFGFSRNKGDKDENQFGQIVKIGYASGTCLFTSLQIMKKLEMFDEFLFAYHDDLDLGWRALLQCIPSYYVPKSIVYHPPEGFSFKWSHFKYYLLERNRIYCLLTHYSRSTFYKMLPALILVDIAVVFFYLKRGMLFSKIKANLSIIKNWKKIKQRYNYIQQQRQISDADVIRIFQDGIAVPNQVANEESTLHFNTFLTKLSKKARTKI